MADNIVLGYKNTVEFQATARIAYEKVRYYRKLFDEKGIDPEGLTLEDLRNIRLQIQPKDIPNPEMLPEYLGKKFAILTQTSGSSGIPKPRYFTRDDFERIGEQLEILTKYPDEIKTTLTILPATLSSSGEMIRNGLEELSKKYDIPIRYIWIQPTVAQDPKVVERLIRSYNPTFLITFVTSAIQLAHKLPKEVREIIRLLGVGGETLPDGIADLLFELYPNLVAVLDAYGSTEDGMTCIKEITKEYKGAFECKRSIIVGKKDDELSPNECYLFITSVTGDKEPGLFLINYDIGDVGETDGEKILRIYRKGDAISLSAAKLNLREVADAIVKILGIEAVDFRVEYRPLTRENLIPSAKIQVAAKRPITPEEKKAILDVIFENNSPVNYEVNVAKRAKLEIDQIPVQELIQKLYPRPGKPKRLEIIS